MKMNKNKYLISARAVAMAIASCLPRITPQWGSDGSRNSRKSLAATFLALFCMLVIASCSDKSESLTPEPGSVDELKSDIIGTWVNSVDGDSSTYCAYGIYADGRFEYYTAESPARAGEKVHVDSISGAWKPLQDIPNRWDPEATEMLRGIEVTFDAELETILGGNLVDTLVVEKDEEGGILLMWTSEIDEYAAALAGADGGQTRGFFKKLWNAIKETVVRTFKKIAYPISDFFVTKLGGETHKIVKGNADWMGKIYGDVNPKVCEMTIPGAHDAFTYYYSGIAKRGVTTQGLDIAKMWDAGVRCFDVRMAWRKQDNAIGLNHGIFYLGINLDQGLNMIRDQLRAHSKETAIVILKFDDGESQNDYKVVYNTIQRLKKEGYVVDNPSPDIRLNQCRGKMIIIQRYGNNSYNMDIRATGWNENGQRLLFRNGKSTDLGVADLYTGNTFEFSQDFYKRKKNSMTAMFEKAASTSGDRNLWCFNHASGYLSITPLDINPGQIAEVMNPWVKDYVNSHKGKKTGVVMLDFAGTNYHFFGYNTNGQEVIPVLINNNVDLRNDQRISLE